LFGQPAEQIKVAEGGRQHINGVKAVSLAVDRSRIGVWLREKVHAGLIEVRNPGRVTSSGCAAESQFFRRAGALAFRAGSGFAGSTLIP
jgi:hypothetical protein